MASLPNQDYHRRNAAPIPAEIWATDKWQEQNAAKFKSRRDAVELYAATFKLVLNVDPMEEWYEDIGLHDYSASEFGTSHEPPVIYLAIRDVVEEELEELPEYEVEGIFITDSTGTQMRTLQFVKNCCSFGIAAHNK
jgi:hypothetical protein